MLVGGRAKPKKPSWGLIRVRMKALEKRMEEVTSAEQGLETRVRELERREAEVASWEGQLAGLQADIEVGVAQNTQEKSRLEALEAELSEKQRNVDAQEAAVRVREQRIGNLERRERELVRLERMNG